MRLPRRIVLVRVVVLMARLRGGADEGCWINGGLERMGSRRGGCG